MKLKFNKYKFVHTKLKNRIFISFTVNLLIGILFSFPVFSSQLNVQSNVISKYTSNITESETCVAEISDNNFNTSVIFPGNKATIFSKTVFIKKNSSPGNKDNTKISSSPFGFREHNALEVLSKSNNLNFTFVNLSYLKDLKTTRMLC